MGLLYLYHYIAYKYMYMADINPERHDNPTAVSPK